MYIYLLVEAYVGESILHRAVNDEQAIAEWEDWTNHVPGSVRLRRVHNTGSEIVKDEYIHYEKRWQRIDWSGHWIEEA